MYRINNLARPVLITVDEVITKAVVDQNADIRYLLNSIEVAEERWIAPALGDAFYEDFITKKNLLITSGNKAAMLATINDSLVADGKAPATLADLRTGVYVNAIELCPLNYQTLWNRHLWRICAEAVDVMHLVPSWLRSTAQGQTYNNPKVLTSEHLGSASGDKDEVEFKMKTMVEQRIYPLIARMKKWLQDTGGYGLYEGNGKATGTTNRVGGIIFGAYGGICDDDSSCTPCSTTTTSSAATNATTTKSGSITIEVKETPNPDVLLKLRNGLYIPKQYPVGDTITVEYLKAVNWVDPSFILNKLVNEDISYDHDNDPGVLDNTAFGGFFDGDKLTIKYEYNA